jgi:predicted DNA-binding antitoxin AbrB/MazE fold protein
MTKQVEAIYEDGMLRPLEPLPLEEHQRVRVTVSSLSDDPLTSMVDYAFERWARQEVARAPHIPTLEEVQRMTADDHSSWAEAIIAERVARF